MVNTKVAGASSIFSPDFFPLGDFSCARQGSMLFSSSSKLRLAWSKAEMSSKARYNRTAVNCKHVAALLPQEDWGQQVPVHPNTCCGTSSLPQPYPQHCTPWLAERHQA